MSIVFDRPPGQDEESDAERSATKSGGLDFLLVPDRATFDRMRSVINGEASFP